MDFVQQLGTNYNDDDDDDDDLMRMKIIGNVVRMLVGSLTIYDLRKNRGYYKITHSPLLGSL